MKRQKYLDMNYIRQEIQKIIDNHLKGKPERFSVEDWEAGSLRLLIDLLTWLTTREEIKERQKKNEKELEKTYEEVLNIQDNVNALVNVNKDMWLDLSQFKADISLWQDLDRL